MSERISIAGIPVDVLKIEELHAKIDTSITARNETLVLYANAHLVQLAHYEEKWLVDYYKHAEIVICDGVGIQLGAKITRQQVPIKIPYNTWFWSFLTFLRKHSHSIYLLGGSQQVIDSTAVNFLASEPDLRIAGRHHGYFSKDSNSPETASVINSINESKAGVLLIGLGMPIQEKWIRENRHRIKIPVIMTCGGAFDFFSGRQPVAPPWMRGLGLEWLYRLMREPGRMLFRYTIGNIRYLWLVVRQSLGARIQ